MGPLFLRMRVRLLEDLLATEDTPADVAVILQQYWDGSIMKKEPTELDAHVAYVQCRNCRPPGQNSTKAQEYKTQLHITNM